jgi:hypothetical protein
VIAFRYGIPLDRARHERWAAWICLEEGRRWAALGHYTRAVKAGDIASLARAALALIYPQVARHDRPQALDPWMREAQAWLNALRSTPAHTAGEHPAPRRSVRP